MKKWAFLILIVILVFGVCRFASGEEKTAPCPVYYENIEIASGDTLWGLAQKYNRWGTMTTKKYVAYIMQFNHMDSDEIRQGQHLIIPVI